MKETDLSLEVDYVIFPLSDKINMI